MKQDPLLVFLGLVVGLMVYATLYPFHFTPLHSPILNWHPADSRSSWLDVCMNLYFFMPFGLLAGIRFRSHRAVVWILLACILLSTAVEVAQAYIPGRDSSLRDVLLNSLGGFLGVMLANLPVFDRELFDQNLARTLEHRGELLLLFLYLVYQFFPFLPILRMTHVIDFRRTLSTANWARIEVFEAACLASFAGLLFAAIHSPRASLWFSGILMAFCPVQIFLWGRSVRIEDVLAPMVGFGLVMLLVATGLQVPDKWILTLAALLLVHRQLQPWHWEPQLWNPMEWIPLRAAFEIPRDSAIRILSLKAFLYWFVLRQAGLVLRTSPFRVALALAGFLLISELGQMYQVGRTPETTDPWIAMLGALPWFGLGRRRDQGL